MKNKTDTLIYLSLSALMCVFILATISLTTLQKRDIKEEIIEESLTQVILEDPIPEIKEPEFIIEENVPFKGNIDDYIDYCFYIKKFSNKYDIDPKIICGLIQKESKFKKNVDSFLGASYGRGAMQVSEIGLSDFNNKNADGKYYSANDLYDIEKNLEVGCWIYNQNKVYLRNMDVVITERALIISYNTGCKTYAREKYTTKYYEQLGYSENSYYFDVISF